MARTITVIKKFRCPQDHVYGFSVTIPETGNEQYVAYMHYPPDGDREWLDPLPAFPFPVCPNCASVMEMDTYSPRLRNAQVGLDEAAAVAIHPGTGHVMYCFLSPGQTMPKRYAEQGYRKVQFQSLASLRKFCNDHGKVNDIEYDNPHEGYIEEVEAETARIEAQRDRHYQEERREAAKAIQDEQRYRRRR